MWKVVRVCPIHKSGNRKNVKNYWPVSIISAPAKIFEQIIYKHLFQHVSSAISVNQHGFMPQRSTVTNLLSITDYVSGCLDDGIQVDAVYLDMTKAFDRIKHSHLLRAIKILVCLLICVIGLNRTYVIECNMFSSMVRSQITMFQQAEFLRGQTLGLLCSS